MKDLSPHIRQLLDGHQPFAMATVVRTWRSAPRPVGSSMLVTSDGQMTGSVSGGCVENVVIDKAMKVLAGDPPLLAKFGVTDEDAWEVGLSCGGEISVYIDHFLGGYKKGSEDAWAKVEAGIRNEKSMAIVNALTVDPSYVVIVEHSSQELSGMDSLQAAIGQEVRSALSARQSSMTSFEEVDYFIHVLPKPSILLMIGSSHITSELNTLAGLHDFKTIVIDPRDTFSRKTTYEAPPDELLVKWPQEILHELPLDGDTYAVILSHDPKIDDEALNILLNSQVQYIGALGSKKTHQKRMARLKERGFSDALLKRIHAPVGVDIGARTPREIALSVMSEVVLVMNRKIES